MEKQRIKNRIIQFWATPEMDAAVRKIAQAEGRSNSSVCREMVEKGLVAAGYRNGSQDVSKMVREAVKEEMKPYVERLATISAKGTQISAAAFFLAAYQAEQATPEYARDEFREIAAQARKLGIEFLKLSRDSSLDNFISQALGRMFEDA